MFFVGIEFLLFLPIVFICYFSLPYKHRWLLLLLSSYFFYTYYSPLYLVIIIASTLVDYFVGIKIEKKSEKAEKRKWLWVSILVNFGLLGFFKYFNFLASELESLLSMIGSDGQIPKHGLALPLGISFYTFQTLSYSIDVYKGKIPAERHFGKYALYVSFFPQLVAGPIERAKKLLSQFHFEFDFEYRRVVEGLQLMLWGFFKKVVIADRIGLYVNEVFDPSSEYTGITIWIASILFIIQVFCDFSAYSNIAIGIARILGVKLTRNFGNSPYFMIYLSSFFRTWHITLTNWVRDYIYMPLLRQYKEAKYRGALLIFVLSLMGLWHGANWTYIIWGAILGFYMAVEYYTDGWKEALFEKLNNWQLYIAQGILIGINLFLLGFACLFFRANSLEHAVGMISKGLNKSWDIMVIHTYDVFLIFFFWLVLEIFHYLMGRKMIHEYLGTLKTIPRWGVYFFLVLSISIFGIFSSEEFIYFDF